ncbi:hypothetical protein [Planktotalea arctica]|uniref:hypothetical protein n=1 Tax=Planktotalea arctica TaxID=1481893 RepID=UPI000A173714|nr:hypothetical protein [Planktotalea arctica]
MQNFDIAKRMLVVLVIVGWVVVALAVLGFLSSLFGSAKETAEIGFAIALLASGALALFGLVIIAIAQMGLTQIATAENTGEMLRIMRKQTQSVSTATAPVMSAPSSGLKKTKEVGSAIKTYKGYLITKAKNGVEVSGNEFSNVLAAEKWVNQNPKT